MNFTVSEQVLSSVEDKYIVENLEYLGKRRNVLYRIMKYCGTAAACFLAIFVLSFSVVTVAAAAGSLTAYDILYSLYPQIAVKLVPVNVACEDNGIRMCVEGIDISGERADIYISMQDLEGGRIDETIDLFDSYSIRSSCAQIGGCSLVDYNEDSQTATFLISVQQLNGKPIEGRRMTFNVSEFLSGKTEADMEIKEISVSDAAIVTDMQKGITLRGYGYGPDGSISAREIPGYLIADEKIMFSPVEGVSITAYGFIDNHLHIQAYYEDTLNSDNHGWLYLRKSDGTVIHPLGSASFWDDNRVGSYDEYVFDISSEDNLEDCAVWGRFCTCKTITRGNWEVTFSIEEIK